MSPQLQGLLAHRFVVFVLPLARETTKAQPAIFNKSCTQDRCEVKEPDVVENWVFLGERGTRSLGDLLKKNMVINHLLDPPRIGGGNSNTFGKFHPATLGEDSPILTSIFFQMGWFKTTN